MFPIVDSCTGADVPARRTGELSGYRITKPAPTGSFRSISHLA